MARINGPIQVWSRSDTVPTDVEGGYAGGDSTAAAVGTSLDQSSRALGTVDNLAVTGSTLDYGQEATATITGTSPNKTINIGIPKGMPEDTATQIALDAQASAASAAQSAADAATAMAAQFMTQDEGVATLITNDTAGPLTRDALEARRAFTYATDYGAVGDGVTDDTAAIQAALDTGKNVILSAGTYLVSSLSLTRSGQRLSGWSRSTTKIISTTGDVLTTHPTAHVGSLELSDLWIESRAGGGHCLNIPYGIHQSTIQRVDFVQRNDAMSAVYCDRTGFTNGGLFDVKFTDFRISMPKTSTVPGVYIVGGGNPASACLWHRGRIEGGGTYLVHIEGGLSSTTYAYDNAFDSINFEFADHGAIRLLSCLNTTLTKIGFFDNGTITTDLITVGRSAGSGPLSRGVNINGLHRSGGTLNSGMVDVRFQQPMGGGNHVTAVSAPSAAGMTLDVGNTATFLAGIDDTVTVISTQATTGESRFILSGTPIIAGAGEPEGVVSAPVGSLYMRSTGAATGRLYYKEVGSGATGWRSSSQPADQPTTNLASAAHSINTASKSSGRPVFNSTTKQPLWASGPNATDPWVDATGASVITPS